MRRVKSLAALLFAAITPFLLAGEGKISGKVYADYFYIFSNHNSSLEGMNGFWFRRINFSYDYRFNSATKIRVRFEAKSRGDFLGSDKIHPYVKDLYLQWKKGNHAIILGISPTPTFHRIEKIWGYRSVEKTPLDLYKMAHSRGTGIALVGKLMRGKFYYHLMFSNGEGLKSEINKQKKVMAALGFSPAKKVYFEVYGDYEAGPLPNSAAFTLQGFASVETKNFAGGMQYSEKTYQEDIKLRVASAFLRFKLGKKLVLLGRADRMMDPNPDAQRIEYLPLDPTSPFTLIILGIDYRFSSRISLIPNVEVVTYDDVGNGDTLGKITLYYRW